MMWRRGRIAVVLTALLLLVGACGDDDSAPVEGSTTTAGPEDQPAAPSGSGGGTLVLGDETIQLDSSRCFLQSQPVAGSEGNILATAQGFGTNAAGDEVSIDFTRFDEESQFTGDDISVVVGNPFSDSSVSYFGGVDLGAVDISGSVVSSPEFTLTGPDFEEITGSFVLEC
jgi:hypothetical protein